MNQYQALAVPVVSQLLQRLSILAYVHVAENTAVQAP